MLDPASVSNAALGRALRLLCKRTGQDNDASADRTAKTEHADRHYSVIIKQNVMNYNVILYDI